MSRAITWAVIYVLLACTTAPRFVHPLYEIALREQALHAWQCRERLAQQHPGSLGCEQHMAADASALTIIWQYSPVWALRFTACTLTLSLLGYLYVYLFIAFPGSVPPPRQAVRAVSRRVSAALGDYSDTFEWVVGTSLGLLARLGSWLVERLSPQPRQARQQQAQHRQAQRRRHQRQQQLPPKQRPSAGQPGATEEKRPTVEAEQAEPSTSSPGEVLSTPPAQLQSRQSKQTVGTRAEAAAAQDGAWRSVPRRSGRKHKPANVAATAAAGSLMAPAAAAGVLSSQVLPPTGVALPLQQRQQRQQQSQCQLRQKLQLQRAREEPAPGAAGRATSHRLAAAPAPVSHAPDWVVPPREPQQQQQQQRRQHPGVQPLPDGRRAQPHVPQEQAVLDPSRQEEGAWAGVPGRKEHRRKLQQHRREEAARQQVEQRQRDAAAAAAGGAAVLLRVAQHAQMTQHAAAEEEAQAAAASEWVCPEQPSQVSTALSSAAPAPALAPASPPAPPPAPRQPCIPSDQLPADVHLSAYTMGAAVAAGGSAAAAGQQATVPDASPDVPSPADAELHQLLRQLLPPTALPHQHSAPAPAQAASPAPVTPAPARAPAAAAPSPAAPAVASDAQPRAAPPALELFPPHLLQPAPALQPFPPHMLQHPMPAAPPQHPTLLRLPHTPAQQQPPTRVAWVPVPRPAMQGAPQPSVPPPAAPAAAAPLAPPAAPAIAAAPPAPAAAFSPDDGLMQQLCCPITHEPMRDPVMAADGHTYERVAIEGWIMRQQAAGQPPASPLTNTPLESLQLRPNLMVRSLVANLLER